VVDVTDRLGKRQSVQVVAQMLRNLDQAFHVLSKR
jgi:hypothetical protein